MIVEIWKNVWKCWQMGLRGNIKHQNSLETCRSKPAKRHLSRYSPSGFHHFGWSPAWFCWQHLGKPRSSAIPRSWAYGAFRGFLRVPLFIHRWIFHEINQPAVGDPPWNMETPIEIPMKMHWWPSNLGTWSLACCSSSFASRALSWYSWSSENGETRDTQLGPRCFSGWKMLMCSNLWKWLPKISGTMGFPNQWMLILG